MSIALNNNGVFWIRNLWIGSFTGICGIYPFQTYTSATYTITKLSNRKLWLKHENEEHEYLIKLN